MLESPQRTLVDMRPRLGELALELFFGIRQRNVDAVWTVSYMLNVLVMCDGTSRLEECIAQTFCVHAQIAFPTFVLTTRLKPKKNEYQAIPRPTLTKRHEQLVCAPNIGKDVNQSRFCSNVPYPLLVA